MGTATEKKLLKKCLGDADGDSTNNVEVYDWDYGAIKYWSEEGDTYLMSGTPHAIKLVKKSPSDDYDGGKFALIWYNPKTTSSTSRPSRRTPPRSTRSSRRTARP